jgi:hypothetical protein
MTTRRFASARGAVMMIYAKGTSEELPRLSLRRTSRVYHSTRALTRAREGYLGRISRCLAFLLT